MTYKYFIFEFNEILVISVTYIRDKYDIPITQLENRRLDWVVNAHFKKKIKIFITFVINGSNL